ncbi:GAF domain-containing protein, partial [Priestia megaterium]
MNDSFSEKLASAVVRWSHHQELAGFAHDCALFCADVLEGCTFAALGQTGRRMRLSHLAATGTVDDAPWHRQLQWREGPSFHAVATGATVSASALDAGERWPRWSAAWTAVNGHGAVRAFPLRHEDTIIGVLELWTRRPEDAARLPATLSEHVAAHFAMVRRHEHLDRALTTRTVVGQAQG